MKYDGPYRGKAKVGDRHGLLTLLQVIRFERRKCDWLSLWRCDCGSECERLLYSIRKGDAKSCGCLHTVANRKRATHGESAPTRGGWTPEYCAWANMISRCYDTARPEYHRYAGRGITVCSEWRQSYSSFLSYVGRRPSPKHSIDRYPNNDGNYEPGNVRWATIQEQSDNRRRHSRAKSRFRGLRTYRSVLWRVYIRGKYMGVFNKEVNAATAYNFWAEELFGEEAQFNIAEKTT